MFPLCAICDMTNATADICSECRKDPANVDWCEQSDLEQTAEDVDVTVAVAGGDRLESVFGGARKMDTEKARRLIRVSLWYELRWCRRRNAQGYPLRGWEWREKPLSLRVIAELSGCKEAYVRKVLSNMAPR